MTGIPTVDLRNMTQEDKDNCPFEMWNGIAVPGKIEGFSFAGVLEDPNTKQESKQYIMQISAVIPEEDLEKYRLMTDDNNMVDMLLCPIKGKDTPDKPPEMEL